MNKQEALKEAQKRRVEAAERAFQTKVEDLLGRIESLSSQLAGAKEALMALDYEAPKEVQV